MPNLRWLLALITAVHRFVYRVTDGRVGARLVGHTMLLLESRGRRSGEPRVTPLLYVPHDDRWLLIASNAGDDRYPAWYHNLRASPDTRIQVGRQHFDVCARVPGSDERKDLWRTVVAAYPRYDDYAKRTEREIPVVVLERRGAASA